MNIMFPLTFVNKESNYISLPDNTAAPNTYFAALSYSKQTHFYFANDKSQTNKQCIEISKHYAKFLQLTEGEIIRLELLKDAPQTTKCQIVITNHEDFLKIMSNRDKIEKELLNQTTILKNYSEFPIYVDSQIIPAQCISYDNSQYLILKDGTELDITYNQVLPLPPQKTKSVSASIKLQPDLSFTEISITDSLMENLGVNEGDLITITAPWNEVYSHNTVDKYIKARQRSVMATFILVMKVAQRIVSSSYTIGINAKAHYNFLFEKARVLVSPYSKLEIGKAEVTFKTLKGVDELYLRSYLKQLLKKDRVPFAINHKLGITTNDIHCNFKIVSKSEATKRAIYIINNPNELEQFISSTKIKIKQTSPMIIYQSIKENKFDILFCDLYNKQIVEAINIWKNSDNIVNSIMPGVVVVGRPSVGKSYFLLLLKRLIEETGGVVTSIDGKYLLRKAQSVSTKFIDEYLNLFDNAPRSRVILFDNIDVLCNECSTELVNSHFVNVICDLLPAKNVFYVFTANSLESINKAMLKHLIHFKIIELTLIDTNTTKQIYLNHEKEIVPTKEQNVSTIYTNIYGLAINAERMPILPAQQIYIEGMIQAKQAVEDYIILPLQNPKFFSNQIIKLPRGILLYGPSGCGKTQFGSYLSSLPGIAYFPIRGPELLGKFIGQSEQNIRDLFEKAKNSQPSIIFFDEFDSFAPTRGEGSTGVTDRIVNQLLTYIDGVEDIENIFIVAASSRPSNIDPALLRSGRIGIHIYCGFPNMQERSAMLWKEFQTDLTDLAKDIEGFTGADIHELAEEARKIGTTVNSVNLNEILKKLKPTYNIKEKQQIEEAYKMFSANKKIVKEMLTLY